MSTTRRYHIRAAYEPVRQMTRAEKKWVRELQDIMSRAPQTLELMTIGDRYLSVLCADGARGEIADGAAHKRGIVLAEVSSTIAIAGTTG